MFKPFEIHSSVVLSAFKIVVQPSPPPNLQNAFHLVKINIKQ